MATAGGGTSSATTSFTAGSLPAQIPIATSLTDLVPRPSSATADGCHGNALTIDIEKDEVYGSCRFMGLVKGSAKNLVNRFLLIAAGAVGSNAGDARVFEATKADGKVVWEFQLDAGYGVYRANRIDRPCSRPAQWACGARLARPASHVRLPHRRDSWNSHPHRHHVSHRAAAHRVRFRSRLRRCGEVRGCPAA